MQEDGIKELYEILEEYESTEEVIKDINTVQSMIENNNYNKDEVIKIEAKYSVETMFLMDLEESTDMGFETNYEDPALQVLLNLRDRLYMIGVYKILKEKGKEITKEIISDNYYDLIKLVNED